MNSAVLPYGDVLQWVATNVARMPGARAIHLSTIPPAPPLEARASLGPDDIPAIRKAQDLRESMHLPFWDGVMLCASHSADIPSGILQAAAFHQEVAPHLLRLPVDDVTPESLRALATGATDTGRLLVFTSEMEMEDGTRRHVPLLDFHVGYSDRATNLVAKVTKLLGYPGALVSSGKSYHFYGSELVAWDDVVWFLGRALLYAPITDRTWIAHQLAEGRCALRVSSRKDYGGPPQVLRLCD